MTRPVDQLIEWLVIPKNVKKDAPWNTDWHARKQRGETAEARKS